MPASIPPNVSKVEPPSAGVQVLGVNITLPHGTYRNLSVKLAIDQRTRKKRDFGPKNTELQWIFDTTYAFQNGPPLYIQLGDRSLLGTFKPISSWSLSFADAHEAICLCPKEAIEYPLKGDPKLILTLSSSDNDSVALRSNAELLRRQKTVLDRLGKWESTAATSMEFMIAISEANSIAKAVLASVNVVYKILKEKQQCNQLILELVEDMAKMLDYLEEIKQFAELEILKEAMEGAVPLVDETQQLIIKHYSQDQPTSTIRFAFSPPVLGQIQDIRDRFRRFKEYVDRAVAIQSAKMIASANEEKILADLTPKDIGEFKWPAGCMDGTRQDILDMIEKWTKDFNAPNILWIKGHPGVGKSALASSVMDRLSLANRLGSRFMFERAKAEVLTPSALWRVVSLDLFRKYPTVKKHLMAKRRDDGHLPIPDKLDDLFHQLIQIPLIENDGITEENAPVIVIDALDECGGLDGHHSQHRIGLLRTLSKWQSFPSKFKILLTSRDETDIQVALQTISKVEEIGAGSKVSDQSSADIKEFITAHFLAITKRYSSLPTGWPGPKTIQHLVNSAGGLFIWARVVMEFIARRNPERSLAGIEARGGGIDGMALLYSEILKVSFSDPSPEDLDDFHAIVGAVILAKRPLSAKSIGLLLATGETTREYICKELNSVLESGDVLRISHQSFTDFLLNEAEDRSRFCISKRHEERRLALACLRTMKSGLKFNICNLESSYRLNSEVIDMESRIDRFIPAHLQYACWYWADHLAVSEYDDEILDLLKNFMDIQFLFWLEILSVTGRMNTASRMISSLMGYLKKHQKDTTMAIDMQKFITAFASVISQSAPHIYVSALPSAPQSLAISKKYMRQYPGSLKVEKGGLHKWPVIQNIFQGHTKSVNSIAFSPDGRRIASGSNDNTIRIWDTETGEAVAGPLGGHTGPVLSVTFSPDGGRIASGSYDSTIRIWDAERGKEIAEPFKGHTGPVLSVAFSPDGGRIASGSDDHTIRIWDAEKSEAVAKSSRGHTDWVRSIAFLPDGRRIVSGSNDNTIRIWDAETCEAVGGPFSGHTSSVWSVAISPDGRLVASGSYDKTIRIWDAETGEAVGEPFRGHTSSVCSVAFSPDGRRIASGSYDKTIRIWDAETGEAVAEPFKGHTDAVRSLAFSPDGRHIASGSHDNTIGIWDAETGKVATEPFRAHTDAVRSVAFSPDGRHIASGSYDHTIRIWDAETGEAVGEPFRGHTSPVCSVTFSPDGECIASGSYDSTIRIWDAETGEAVLGPFRGHTGAVRSVVFSPDGMRIVSGSNDRTIRIWDTETGEAVGKAFTGHTSSVWSVAFSPDGRRIASGSDDATVRIWDADTGKGVGEPFRGHTSSVWSVTFSPDGRRIASGSKDSTIRIWDAEINKAVVASFRGHASSAQSVVFSPDGRRIASGYGDATVRIWDAETGRTVAGPFEGHADEVKSVAFSPDGRHVASGSIDVTIRIWDTEYARNKPPSFIDTSRMKEGWIMDSDNNHLFWVPPSLRLGFLRSNTRAIVGGFVATKLNLDTFKHGRSWAQCQASGTTCS